MDTTVILSKLESLPENLKSEVADFIDFLLAKMQKKESAEEQNDKPRPRFGSAKGMFTLKPGWDDPLDEEFKEYM